MARTFAGSTDHANCGVPTFPSTGYTVSLWIYPTSFAPAYSCFFQTNDTPGSANQQIFIKSTNKFAFYLGITVSAGNGFADPASTSATLNTWQHVCMLSGNAVGTNAAYVNGTLDASFPIANQTGLFSYSNSNPLWIGGDQFVAGRNVNGRIADVAYWSVPLTASEVTALSKGARPFTIRPSALLAYYPLDGLQSPEPTATLNNAHNGTLTGTSGPSFGPPFAPFTPRWPQAFDLLDNFANEPQLVMM